MLAGMEVVSYFSLAHYMCQDGSEECSKWINGCEKFMEVGKPKTVSEQCVLWSGWSPE